jgi:dirigent-like protein
MVNPERSGSMKKFHLLAAGAVAAVAAGSAAGAPTTAQQLRFTSISKGTVFSPPASQKSPPQVGGRLVFTDVMYNGSAQLGKPAGARVGRSEGVCTVISVSKPPQAQCLITAHLPNGQIVVVGEGDPGGKSMQYAITGGVGAYAHASGTVTAKTVSDSKTLILVRLSA